MGKELRKREHEEWQLEDRITGSEWKWENQRREVRKLIIISSLYKPISEPQSQRQHVLKNITAVTKRPLYRKFVVIIKGYEDHREQNSLNNYCFTVRVSSSKLKLATNHTFILFSFRPLNSNKLKAEMSLWGSLCLIHYCCMHAFCTCICMISYLRLSMMS